MKEEERLLINEKVEESIKKLDIIEEKNKQIEELEKDEKIQQYLNLKTEVERIRKDLGIGNISSSDKIIDVILEKHYLKCRDFDNSLCGHDIWVYIGSYFVFPRFANGQDVEIKCDDENDEVFKYNKYQCIECNKIIKVEDYKTFEQEHIVLKPKEDVSYQLEYFQLLMDHSVDESQKILVNKYGAKR